MTVVRPGSSQSNETQRSKRSFRAALLFASVSVALIPFGYLSIFMGFRTYDDEGYFVLALKHYVMGQPLFTDPLPIYGPVYFEVMGGLFKILGVTPGLDAGRFVTLFVWLLGVLLAGVAVYRLTGMLWLAVGGQLLTFVVLGTLANEPMQPGGLISLLLLAVIIASTPGFGRPATTALLLGALVAALTLIKINVGIFAAVAVGFAWSGLGGRRRRLVLPVFALAMVALPPLLMSALLSQTWALELSVLMALAGAALGVTFLGVDPVDRLQPLPAQWIVAGAGIVVAASLGAAALGGTRLDEWWNHSILAAVNFPSVFEHPAPISDVEVGWAGVVFGLAVAVRLRYKPGVDASFAGGLVRIWVGLLVWLSMIIGPNLFVALPLAWIAAVRNPRDEANPVDGRARLLLPALAVVGSLQIYPVAGSQVSIAALTLLPVGAIILNDGIRELRLVGGRNPVGLRLANRIGSAAAIVMLIAVLLVSSDGIAGLTSNAPLDLPGSRLVRVNGKLGEQLRAVVAAINRNCGGLITLPGLHSFYLWTGKEPPPGLGSEVWVLVLNNAQQEAVVREVEGDPRLCVLRNQSIVRFWAAGRPVPNGPLVEFIDQGFVSRGSYGDYELLVRRGP